MIAISAPRVKRCGRGFGRLAGGGDETQMDEAKTDFFPGR
jgi:hypothetical protein